MSPAPRGAIRVVLFDLDGVLVESYRAWLGVVNDAAKAFGAPEVTEERFQGVFGQGIAADVESLYPGRTHREVEAAYEEAMARHGKEIRVNPEAALVLSSLRAEGYLLACVTNTQAGIARALLQAAGLLPGLDDLEGMSEGLMEKPAPDLLLAALAVLCVDSEEALMVGDSRYDEEAAAAAGVAFLKYDLRTGASLREALASVLD